jgi:DNA (cytosine-5)-methyltransferase 1
MTGPARESALSRVSPPRVLSVFSGAGGLDLGLEAAGFSHVLCLDNDPVARASLQKSRPAWVVPEAGDVDDAGRSLRPSDLELEPGELDLIAGGPPCQPFSKAAQWSNRSWQGLADPRARPLSGMLDLVGSFLPKAVLLENVPGFLRGPRSVLAPLQDGLERINDAKGTAYALRWWVVDAADYGVPQRRQRAIAVAFRDGLQFELPTPTHKSVPMTAWDALHDLVEDELPQPTGGYTDLLPSIPEGGNYQWLTARGGGPELFGWRTRYWSFLLKLAKAQPSWTLPASPGPNTGPFHWNNRPLSVRERLRLQTFPDDWFLTGSTREQYRLVGNATPPLLGEVFGSSISSALGLRACRLEHELALLPRRKPDIPDPTEPAPVPDRYGSRVGAKSAHPGTGLGPAPRTDMAATRST